MALSDSFGLFGFVSDRVQYEFIPFGLFNATRAAYIISIHTHTKTHTFVLVCVDQRL